MINKRATRCIAKLSGDGNIYPGKNNKNGYVRYSNTCQALREEFKSDMRAIFGKIPLTEGTTNTATPFVQTHRKDVVLFFLKYLNSFRSKDIAVPDEIKKADKLLKKEYLKALYDDEGSPRLRISKKFKEWKRNISLYSNSKVLITEVKNMLENDFGIKCNKGYTDKRVDGRVSFVLDITGKDDFELFKQKIGFNHPIKQEMLNLIIKSYKNAPKKNPTGFSRIKKQLKYLQQSRRFFR